MRTLALILALLAAPATAQNVEIFIPGADGNAAPPVQAVPVNPLAACLANPGAAACRAVSLSPDGAPQLETFAAPQVEYETLIFDPKDTGNVYASQEEPPAPDYTAPVMPDKPVALPAVGIIIEFDFDSDAIRADQFGKVTALVAALQDPALAGTQFAVIGHTDASGSDAYNCNLSRRRALQVTGALQANAVPLALFPVGFGERVLKNAANPTGAENRRVVFLRLPDNPAPILTNAAAVCAGF